jgi:hypothetical protein
MTFVWRKSQPHISILKKSVRATTFQHMPASSQEAMWEKASRSIGEDKDQHCPSGDIMELS